MCSGSRTEPLSSNPTMEDGLQKKDDGPCIYSHMLEFAASDDVIGFSHEVEVKRCDVDETSLWYGRQLGGKKMGFEERTPIMIAAMFGSVNVLKYIVGRGNIDVNRACGSDGASALHCAAAGGSVSCIEIVKLLLDASADPLLGDANGKKPGDLIAPSFKYSRNSNRSLEILLKKISSVDEIRVNQTRTSEGRILDGETFKEGIQGSEKKEFPSDVSLPDINNGIYVTDEFRMYSFKVKPCSRAYSHDWTECPFVHPGENARRRDPRKYPYSCVPCPEFRKGTCRHGDACEYAHGVFECWLHPAQYRTRLCKDEMNCTRKVCFFAHKSEELRPLYASTGSAIPSPRSLSPTSLSLSSSLLVPPISMPPISPSVCASPKNGTMWGKLNFTPPSLQLPSSRLKMASSARDIENILGRKQLVDEFSANPSSPFYWNTEYGRIGEMKPSDFDDVFGYTDSPSFSQLPGHHSKPVNPSDLQSINPHLVSYLSNSPSFLDGMNSSFGLESPGSVGPGMINSRSGAFSKRSKSFVDRGVLARSSAIGGTSRTDLSGWCSPDGKLDWALKGEELNKLRKSATFAIRGGNTAIPGDLNLTASTVAEEPDISWVNSLVKDVSSEGDGLLALDQQQYPWVEPMYIEQEQIFA